MNVLSDLRSAQQIMAATGSSLVVVSKSRVWQRAGQGIRPLYELLADERPNLEGAALADKVMGSAAALLVLHAGITSVYAQVMSKRAQKLLLGNNVYVDCDLLVQQILNRSRTEFCPMEIITADLWVPAQAYQVIGCKLDEWVRQQS